MFPSLEALSMSSPAPKGAAITIMKRTNFKCNKCSSSYKQKSSLRVHYMRKHQDESMIKQLVDPTATKVIKAGGSMPGKKVGTGAGKQQSHEDKTHGAQANRKDKQADINGNPKKTPEQSAATSPKSTEASSPVANSKPAQQPQPGNQAPVSSTSAGAYLKCLREARLEEMRMHPGWMEQHCMASAKNSFKCLLCGAQYKSASNVHRHFFAQHLGGYRCDTCQYRFSDMKSLRGHMRKGCTGKASPPALSSLKKEKPAHARNQCNKGLKASFEEKPSLKKIIEDMGAAGAISMDKIRGRSPENSSKIMQPQGYAKRRNSGLQNLIPNRLPKVETKREPIDINSSTDAQKISYLYACEDCNLRFPTIDAYTQHCFMVHMMLQFQYKCVHCDFRGKAKTNLVDHLVEIHLDRRPHKCLKCNASFENHDGLSVHQELSTCTPNSEKQSSNGVVLLSETEILQQISVLLLKLCPEEQHEASNAHFNGYQQQQVVNQQQIKTELKVKKEVFNVKEQS